MGSEEVEVDATAVIELPKDCTPIASDADASVPLEISA